MRETSPRPTHHVSRGLAFFPKCEYHYGHARGEDVRGGQVCRVCKRDLEKVACLIPIAKTNSRQPTKSQLPAICCQRLTKRYRLLGLVHGSQTAGADLHLAPLTIYRHRDFLNVGFPISVCGFHRERPAMSKLASFATNFALGHCEGSFHHAN